jgi:hypothetical protein
MKIWALDCGAKGVLDYAVRMFPGAPHFNLAIWRFDALRTVIVREMALHKASVADIVVLSAHGGKALPKIVKLWLKQWFGRKSAEPCALMVSFNEDSRDSASAAKIICSLQAESKARDVAVFPHFSEISYSDGDPAGLADGNRPGCALVVPAVASPPLVRGIASETIASDKNDHC